MLGLGGRNSQNLGLPTTAGGGAASSPRFSFNRRGGNDGSARGIHLESPVVTAWKRSSQTIKIVTIICTLCCISIFFGIRSLRYYGAGVKLNCHTSDCTLTLSPLGWAGSTTVSFARNQLVKAYGVKTHEDGTYVSSNPVLKEDYSSTGRKGKKNKKTSTYKGPDENGHFLSYAIMLRDRDPDAPKPKDDGLPEQSIDSIWNFCDREGEMACRLTIRKFRVGQSKRRIRTMIQKVESYVKGRRQKLVVKESAPPSWQGVLMVVLGIVGIVLCLLIGAFSEEQDALSSAKGHKLRGPSTGPGVRRLQKNEKADPPAAANVYTRPTPSKYEVSTQSTTYRPAATTTRKRY